MTTSLWCILRVLRSQRDRVAIGVDPTRTKIDCANMRGTAALRNDIDATINCKVAIAFRRATAAVIALFALAALSVAAQATPTVEIVTPVSGATICGTITVSAAASDTAGIAGVQFQYNGTNFDQEDTAVPYTALAHTNNVPDGVYAITAVARNVLGEFTTSAPITVTVNNSNSYCSSKFIPTFIAYYGAGPTLTNADALPLAKLDLLDITRYRFYEMNTPNTWAAIKAINPNIKIYLYEMGSEDENFDDSTDPMYVQGIDRYDISRGHSMGSLNGDHPELYLLDSQGNRIYNTGYSSGNNYWYLMDIGTAGYQSYWLEAVNADVVNQPWVADGVHADNCLTLILVFSPYSAIPAIYPDDSTWVPAMNGFAAAITAGLHGYGQKLWCNRGGTYSGLQAGHDAWINLDTQFTTPPDIVADEGAFAVAWGPASWSTQFYPESLWKLQIDTLGAISNSKVAIFSHTKLQQTSPGDTGLDNWNQPVTFWQTLWYALGSFSISKRDSPNNAYFFFSGNNFSTDRIWYFDEFDMLDLGKALGPYTVTTINGTNVYAREFQQGYVYVNPTTNSVTVNLPSGCTCRQRTHDNLYTPSSQLPVVTNIQLDGHNAAFVLKN